MYTGTSGFERLHTCTHTYMYFAYGSYKKWRPLRSFPASLTGKMCESRNGCLLEALVVVLGQIWCTHFGHKAFQECCTVCMYVCMTAHVHTYIHVLGLWKIQKPVSLTGKTVELRNGCLLQRVLSKLKKSGEVISLNKRFPCPTK